MKHGRSFAELALVVTAALLVAACGSGPGQAPDPLPTWSPPTWMHGSWSGTAVVPGDAATTVTGTVDASARNLVVSFQIGADTHGFDLAMVTEQGVATIQPTSGTSDDGKPEFAILIKPNAGGTVNSFLCTEVDSTTMDCQWTQTTPPDTDGTLLVAISLTKQPG